jgi:hypothetical protein
MLLGWLERLGRRRVIMDRIDNEPYLERYYLFLKDRKSFPFNIFLHKFLKSDPDDVHDHPWGYFTLILRGGYYEWVGKFNSAGEKIGEIRYWRGPGHFRFCGARTYHRIELDPSVTCWTLFCPGTKVRDWGFWTKDRGWVQWEQYLKEGLFQ